MKKLLLLFFSVVVGLGSFAQTTISSTPVTTATVGQAYSYGISANTTTNNPITISTVGTLPSFLTFSNSGQTSSSTIGGPNGTAVGAVCVDANGNYYAVEASGTRIFKISPDGSTVVWANKLSSDFTGGGALIVGNYLYVSQYSASNSSTSGLTRFDLTSSSPVGTKLISNLDLLSLTYKDGFIYAAAYTSNKIIKYSISNNSYTDLVTSSGPFGLGFDTNNNLLIANFGVNKVTKYSPGTTTGGTTSDIITGLSNPSDVKVDANNNVYVSSYGDKIKKYTSDYSSFIYVSTVSGVRGMSLSTNGVLAYANYSNGQVYSLNTGAVISGTPALADIGTYSITARATDGVTTADQTYTLSVYGPATIGAFPDITKYVNDAAFDLTDPSSNSNGAFTYTSSNTAVATISGSTVTLVGPGTATITATQAADGLYLQTTKTLTLTVNKILPTIQTWASITKEPCEAPFALTAPTSNNTGAFTYSSSNTAVATISGSTVTIVGPGTATITANQAADANYSAGTTTTTLTVASALAFNYSPTNYSFIRGNAITNITPSITLGTAVAYAVTPSLPTGLSINSTTGEISGTPTATSAATTYTVSATTANGCASTATLTLAVINDTPPSALTYSPNQQTVRLNTAITAMSATVSGGTVISYTISPALPTGLTLNNTTGQISGALSVNKTGTEVYTITATNSGGSTTATVTLVYNTAPTDIALSSTSINENNVVGASIGTLSTTDVDAADTHTYTLVSGAGSTDNATFTITGNVLKANVAFDFETKSSYSVRLRTTDAGGLSFEKVFAITINNVNETPTDITLSANSINENNVVGANIGTLSTADVDAGDTFTYTLVSGAGSTDNAAFTISGNLLKANAAFDFETKSSYSIRLRTTDASGLSFEKVFTIIINNVNEAPTNIALSNTNIYEGNSTGTTIGLLTSTDQDANSSFTYSLVGGDVAAFSIAGNTLRANTIFNFANKNSYAIRIRTTDAGGLSFEKDFTISITQMPTILGTGNQIGTKLPTAPSSNPEISKGFVSQLTVVGSGYTSYSWSPSTGLSSTSIANPIARPTQTTTYTLTVTNAFGNSFSTSITVKVNQDYVVKPNNILTPNGDGQNDTWFIENLNNYPNHEVKIFDKLGRLLYTSKNYQNNWDGQANGVMLPQDTYYYTITFGNNVAPVKGFITLIR